MRFCVLKKCFQSVQIFVRGGPAGGEPDDGMVFVIGFPEGKAHMLGKLCTLAVFQNDELLVGRRLLPDAQTLGPDDGLQPLGHINGMTADLKVQIIGKQRQELNTQKSSLGQQRTVL